MKMLYHPLLRHVSLNPQNKRNSSLKKYAITFTIKAVKFTIKSEEMTKTTIFVLNQISFGVYFLKSSYFNCKCSSTKLVHNVLNEQATFFFSSPPSAARV